MSNLTITSFQIITYQYNFHSLHFVCVTKKRDPFHPAIQVSETNRNHTRNEEHISCIVITVDIETAALLLYYFLYKYVITVMTRSTRRAHADDSLPR